MTDENAARPPNPTRAALPAFTPPSSERSRNMAAIRGRNTGIELTVRRAVHAAGFRFRLHQRGLPGRPDIVLSRYRMAVFVHGCFWHGHGCSKVRRPRNNAAYWEAKLAMNVARDARNAAALEAAGWRVTVVWQCTLGDDVARLITDLQGRRAARLT